MNSPLSQKSFLPSLFILLLLFSTSACNDDRAGGDGDNQNVFAVLSALPANVIAPATNIQSDEKRDLGRLLFFDPILSGTKNVSCATCHHPNLAFADGIRLSIGVNGIGLGAERRNGVRINRNAPTIINTAFNGIGQNANYNPDQAPMFWDSRAQSLEEQALLPMLNSEEMRGPNIPEDQIMDSLLMRLNNIAEYQNLFNQAFGTTEINQSRLLAALSAYERSIIANNSPFDQFMRGNESALSEQEQEGMRDFVEVGCADCHGGPMLSDFELHVLGVPDVNGLTDRGAGNFDFRTPSLRNIALTGPYMHNGEMNSLREVLEFYNDISGNRANNTINDNLNRSDLAEEARRLDINGGDIDQIIAFLGSLTDQDFDRSIPSAVPSGLQVGGDIN